MNELIRAIAQRTDEETIAKRSKNALYVVGDMESPFLKAVCRKAEKVGIKVANGKRNYPLYCAPILHDRETLTDETVKWLSVDNDVDNLYNPGMSCVAEAIAKLLRSIGVEGKNVVIIGRGHAVKGLAEELIRQDATVTVCHSKTEESVMQRLLYLADVVINTAPKNPTDAVYLRFCCVMIDLGGCMEIPHDNPTLPVYYGPNDIGTLTTSILLNRVANWT